MSKKIDELLPSDKVVIELGPKTQKNANSGEVDTVEPSKTQEVTYGFFLAATQDQDGNILDEYNERTGYSKSIGRTIKLLGEVSYEKQTTERGEEINVPVAKEFATDASRAKLLKEAEQLLADEKKAAEEAEKKRQADLKAQEEFDKKAEKKRQEEADKKAKEDAKAEAEKDAAAIVEQNAKDGFESQEAADAQAEQDKRAMAELAAKNAANKPAK